MRAGVVRIVAIYATLAALWILLSDRAVGALSADAARVTAVSTWKGWFFVGVTSVILYLLMGRLVDQLRESEASYRALTEQVPAIIYRAGVDPSGTTTYVSPQVEALGYTPAEWLADPTLWRALIHPEDRDRVHAEVERAQRTRSNLATEYRMADRSGRWMTVRHDARVVHPDDGGEAYLQGLLVDITDHRKAQDDLHHLAFHDPLTGLPNRALLLDRLSQTLRLCQREGRVGCLIVLDIDRLHLINEARGHVAGDALLQEVARRLVDKLGPDDTVARLVGDQFAVLVHSFTPTAPTSQHAHVMAQRVHSALHAPFHNGDEELTVTASVGVSAFGEINSDEASDVLRRADTAMDRAKRSGGSQTVFFDEGMGEAVRDRFHVEGSLRRGVAEGELRVYLQAQVDAHATVVGAEALVRWAHPERGLVMPDAFISFAEESDLIIEIDLWVLRAVCELLAGPELVGQTMRLSANVSPRTFRDPAFASTVRSILAQTGADPARLTLEVTEGLMIGNLAEMVASMTEVGDLGINISIDDFGTHYSSLAYLRRLPIHELKIDRAFVQGAPTDPDDSMLVQVMLSVAEHMHLRVVAEGVETPAQAAFLNDRADVFHQGYLYGRPEPAEMWLQEVAGQP